VFCGKARGVLASSREGQFDSAYRMTPCEAGTGCFHRGIHGGLDATGVVRNTIASAVIGSGLDIEILTSGGYT
jgi:hypothetical protein